VALASVVAATFFLWTGTASAVEVKGRFSSSLYGYERSQDSHWRPYIGLNTTAVLARNGRGQSVNFHSNLRWTTDLANKSGYDPQTNVYDAYFRLVGYPFGATINLGRQFVYSSVGSALVDGLRVKFFPIAKMSIDVYGGSAVSPETPDRVNAFRDFGLLGSRFSYRVSSRAQIGINWLLRRSGGSISRHQVGLDGMMVAGKTEFYGRANYDVLGYELNGLMARVTGRPGSWYYSAEFDWRGPSVDGNSIFSVIGADKYKGLRTEAARRVWRNLRLSGQLHWEMFPNDDSWRTVIGIQTSALGLAWHHRSGYGGSSDGLRGYASVRVRNGLDLYGAAYLSRYKIQSEQDDRMDAQASSLGARWRPGSSFEVQLEGQYLRNAVDENDGRIFLRVSKGFVLSSVQQEGSRR